MITVDEKYYNKKEALSRCENYLKTSNVFFTDGSFEKGKTVGGYGIIHTGKNSFEKSGIAKATSPIEMELQAIKHTLLYLNTNKNNIDNIVIFNDCLCAIGKLKKYIDTPNNNSEILKEIAFLLDSLKEKNLLICWLKKETIHYHEKVDSLSKSARMKIK